MRTLDTAKNRTLKDLIASKQLTVAPGCIDPFTAQIIEKAGFDAVYLGGFATGAHLGVPEPLLTMTEQIDHARSVASAVSKPLIVDANAGFGDPMHTARTIREFELAGISAVHIEDQFFPKMMSYHKLPLPDEEIVPLAEMKAKLEAALDARADSSFLVIGRTDAVHAGKGGIEQAIERANIYGETGADLVIAFPDNPRDVERFAKEVEYPTMIMYSEGVGRPRPSVSELQSFGYSLVSYPSTVVMTIYRAVRDVFIGLRENGITGLDGEETAALRVQAQEVMGIPALQEIENRYKVVPSELP